MIKGKVNSPTGNFFSEEEDLYLEATSTLDCESWAAALCQANSEILCGGITLVRALIMEMKEERALDVAQNLIFPAEGENPVGQDTATCKNLLTAARDRKLNTYVQISVAHPTEQSLTRYANTEVVEATRDPLFLTGVTFPSEYPIYEETKIKLTVYDVKDKSQETVLPEASDPRTNSGKSLLGCSTFKVRDLVKSKEQQLSLNLKTLNGGKKIGNIEVSLVKMGEIENGEADRITTDVHEQKCSLVCECTSPEANSGKDNLLNTVFRNPIYKFYRFPSSDNKWICVREQMAESSMSFHIPKQLLSLYLKEDTRRIEQLKELGDLSPHWDNLRQNVLAHYEEMVSVYQESLVELEKHTGSSFKSSCSKGEKSLEFVPINLHLQRMRVHSQKLKDALYDVITIGAPTAHSQGFKNGGLRRLLSRFEAEKKNTGYQCIYYSPENTAKAKEILSSINHLQPLISSHTDLLLNSAKQQCAESLKNSLKTLSETTEQFVRSFKDQLVSNALLALSTARPSCASTKLTDPLNDTEDNKSPKQENLHQITRQDSIPQLSDYDEEEWDRVWANVGKSLNCIIAMTDRLLEQGNSTRENKTECSSEEITSQQNGDWYEQLYPLIITLKDCVQEVVDRAKKSMTFVVFQELACGLPQCLQLTFRRDVVFSQALSGLTCGFIIKLHSSLHNEAFLHQLHTVGLLVQYEGLLSTYSDEVGMLEDMSIGISDLRHVAFKITEAKSEDVLPVVTGRRESFMVEVKLPTKMFELLPQEIKDGKLLYIHPVFFNIGINEQQTIAERFGDTSLQESINQENLEHLEEYYRMCTEKVPSECPQLMQEQSDLKELLENLHQNTQAKKRKNVEIMWLAATICRKMNGVRFTCCKSAKDRTSMSVTLEQCQILRDEHDLHKDFFVRALECMRSGQAQGVLNESDDPEKGCVTDNKPTSRHFYPVALLLVSSHLLVVWLILSLALLLAKYQ
ncbi:type II inositol 3,4-bisphosphate 4-phosphatase isoform X4 [Xenopus laevis]|uniref:Type II inositol 3,4-bisphosphate 4-phosphatase isoform X4 n=1 Tax=Xenopus laevis TaxID=8355 RepID=A0A8J1M190_XENLA|nr:type II inositol 3,4-bisphosphate 4-phosphatase isoform X4 [Xenopus laevis]